MVYAPSLFYPLWYIMLFLVWFGVISYPLYLWHWPLLSYLQIVEPDHPLEYRVAAVVIGIGLAWLSYRFVERPLRFGKSGRIKALALGLIVVGICTAGFQIFRHRGYGSRIPADLMQYLTDTHEDVEKEQLKLWRIGTCHLRMKEEAGKDFSSECTENAILPVPNVVLLGDSTASAIMTGIRALQSGSRFNLSQYTVGACEFNLDGGSACAVHNREALSHIKILKPDVVILHNRWIYYYGPRYDEHESRLKQMVRRLKLLDVGRIVLIGPEPIWNPSLARRLFVYRAIHGYVPAKMAFGLKEKNIFDIDKKLSALAMAEKFEYLSLLEILCDDSGCLTSVDDEKGNKSLTTFDSFHLSPGAARYLLKELEKRSPIPFLPGSPKKTAFLPGQFCLTPCAGLLDNRHWL